MNLNDPSGNWGNPAVAAWQKDQEVNLSMRYAWYNSNYRNTSSEIVYNGTPVEVDAVSSSSEFVEQSFLPNVYGQHQLSDLMAFAWGINVPAASHTKYFSSWAGRYDSVESLFFAVNAGLDLVFKVNQAFSFSVGGSYQLGNVEYVFNSPDGVDIDDAIANGTKLSAHNDTISRYSADSYGFGFQLGASYRLGLKTVLGLSFRSQIIADSEGDLIVFSGSSVTPYDAKLPVRSPSIINLGIKQLVMKGLNVYANVSTSLWSVNDSISMEAGGESFDKNLDWQNTYMISAGSDYALNRMFALRGGVSYESSAMKDDYASTAYVNFEKWSLNAGVGVDVSQITIDIAYGYDFKTTNSVEVRDDIDDSTKFNFDADYLMSSNRILLGLSSQI